MAGMEPNLKLRLALVKMVALQVLMAICLLMEVLMPALAWSPVIITEFCSRDPTLFQTLNFIAIEFIPTNPCAVLCEAMGE